MEILYEDARVIVCIKPAGIVSTDAPGGMPELLRQQLGTDCVRTVHRLDRPVSGVMVFARSRMASALLSQQVQDHVFRKEYLAVLCGVPESPEGVLEDLLLRMQESRRTVVVSEPQKDAKPAKLRYQVLETADGRALVRVLLETGRTHQIRAQFSSRGLPLVGDRKYGFEGPETEIALFSCRVAFRHPQTDEAMDFFRLPPDAAPWSRYSCLHERTLSPVAFSPAQAYND